MYPKDLKYTKEHEWVRVDGDQVTIGITTFAAEQLGEVVFVDPPEIGAEFAQGDEIGSIESVKAVAEVYAPVTGKLVKFNDKLEDSPELINEAPHEAGWLYTMKATNLGELDALMDATAYTDFVAAEAK